MIKRFIKNKIRKKLLFEEKIPFKMELPNDIILIKNIFKKNKYKLYVVGGAVRDALLSKIPKDFDLVTDAVPDVVEDMLHKSGFKTLPTGKAFGVINVFTDSGEYEIATMREDIGSGRRPDSVIFTNIETDVKRRDLTINALFYDIDTNEIVDLVGGVNDLKNGIVKTVGNPEDRFSEDRLRILRAIRFAARFGSGLDIEVDKSLSKDASLEGISPERIRDEFIKGIKSSKSVKYFMGLLDKYKLFDWILNGLNINKNFIENKDYILVLSILLKNNNPKILQNKLNSLKYTVEEIRDIVFLINLLQLTPENAVQLKKMQKLTNLTNQQIENFGNYGGLDTKLLDAFLRFNLTVNGNDLMLKLNLKPGKELGDAINKAEYNKFLELL